MSHTHLTVGALGTEPQSPRVELMSDTVVILGQRFGRLRAEITRRHAALLAHMVDQEHDRTSVTSLRQEMHQLRGLVDAWLILEGFGAAALRARGWSPEINTLVRDTFDLDWQALSDEIYSRG